MSIATKSPHPAIKPPPQFQVPRYRFTVRQYHRLGQAGILGEDERVELLDGEIVQLTPLGSRHVACVNRNSHQFTVALSGRAIVSSQNPIVLGDFSEPQPDLALLRWRDDFYAQNLARCRDVLLAIEVGDSSVDLDRRVKVPLYAKARIAELWLINLQENFIEVYRQPKRGRYASVQRYERGGRLHCAAFPEVSWPVDDLLGSS